MKVFRCLLVNLSPPPLPPHHPHPTDDDGGVVGDDADADDAE